MISVPLPTSLTDAFVDRQVDLCVELQSEGVSRGKWMAPLAPLAAPCSTAVNRTALQRHHRKEGKGGHETHSTGEEWAGEQMCVSMDEDFRGLPYKVWLRVQFC